MQKNIIRNFKKKIMHKIRDEVNIDLLKSRGLEIGRNCNIQSGVVIDKCHCCHIFIGDDVTLSPRVIILAHDASTKRHLGYTRIGKVIIGNKVFIGAGSIILPGTIIGDNSIIGAGSVVSKNIPENSVAAGNPARVLCSLEDFLSKHKTKMKNCPSFGEEYKLESLTSFKIEEMNKKMGNRQGYII